MLKVSVIVVNYNREDLVIDCLAALGEQLLKDFEIILVDNGSTDNSLYKIKRVLENRRPSTHIKLVPMSANMGFTGGNLVGLSETEAEYVALLNNDTVPDKHWLGSLVNIMETTPDVGICASKMLIYGTDTIDSAGDGFATSLKGFKRGEWENEGEYDTGEYVFGACAGAALYRRKMIQEIGFFDQDFFLIQEDTDLNLRAQLAGWKVKYVPSAVVYHKVRSTIGHMSDTAIYYSLRNSELVRIKNIPFLLFLRCLPEFAIGEILDFIYFALKHRNFQTYVKAKIAVLKSLRKALKKRGDIMRRIKKVDNKYLYSIMTPVWNKKFFTMKIKKFLHG
jgi:GT2 family glycosyltransferase